jgi:predicted RNA methylase
MACPEIWVWAVGDASTAEADIAGKVDVIVTEIFDSELLGEGILPTMRHAVRHLLKVCHFLCSYAVSARCRTAHTSGNWAFDMRLLGEAVGYLATFVLWGSSPGLLG